MGRADVKNCVKLYTTADEIGATALRDHCSTLISTHWVRPLPSSVYDSLDCFMNSFTRPVAICHPLSGIIKLNAV